MKNRKLIPTLVLAGVLLCGTAFAANTVRTQMIEANYMGIRVVIDGLEIEPKDATGHAVEPFASNGTTYLPVRAVAQALGKDVEWDGENCIVYIGDHIPGKETNWMTKLPPYQVNNGTAYDGTDHKSFFTVAGKDQTQGVTLATLDFYGYGASLKEPRVKDTNSSIHCGGFALWNTDCKYKTMNLTIGHMGDTEMDCKLEVYLDGVYSTTYDLPWDAAPMALSIPLNAAPNVKLEVVNSDTNIYGGRITSEYGIYDISFSE